MTTLALLEAGDRLSLEVWDDPLLERLGHDPRSAYVERFWLPVLGPSTVFLLRHLAGLLDEGPPGRSVAPGEVARAIGLGERAGRGGPFARTLARAVDFDMARLAGTTLSIRRRIPPLPRRHLARLPAEARDAHERLARTGADRGPDELRRKARQLALSLARLGEDEDATERQLRQWRFEADLARDCARWAGRVAGPGGQAGWAGRVAGPGGEPGH